MLVIKIMQVLKNLFGLNKKIAASEIAIKNSNGEGVTLDEFLNTLDVYSTEEHIIGTWIDGKTLYSKTLVFTVLPNTTNEVSISDLNYETIMIDYGASFLLNKDNSIKPITCYESSSYYIRTETNHGGKMLRVYTQGSWYYEGTITVTVNYTKTTD